MRRHCSSINEDAAEYQCGGEPEQSRRRHDGRRGLPAEVIDPQAERHRAGELAETAGLLHQSDGRRHRRRARGGVRRCRIDRAGRKTADSERQRGDERDPLRRKHAAIDGEAENAKNKKAAAMLAQIGTPARSRKPDEICPMVLTAKTRALSRPAAPSDTSCTDVSRSGSAKASEKIWHE